MANAQTVAAQLETIPTVGTLVAQYVSTNPDGTVQVDFGDGPVTVYSAGLNTPLPGAGVRVLRLNGFTLMLGVVKPQPAYGVVVATGTPNLTVRLPDGTEVALGYISSYAAPAINDNVVISWADGGIVLGSLVEIPTTTYVPPEPVGNPPARYSPVFVAASSGNFYVPGARWNADDVWSSASNTGAWFYNNIAGTIPDNAVVTLVELYVTEFYNQHPAVQAKIGLHTLSSKSGNPGISSAVPISRGTGWKVLPNSFGDALKTGAAKGVGAPTVPSGASYHKFRGRAADASSGKLRITYTV